MKGSWRYDWNFFFLNISWMWKTFTLTDRWKICLYLQNLHTDEERLSESQVPYTVQVDCALDSNRLNGQLHGNVGTPFFFSCHAIDSRFFSTVDTERGYRHETFVSCVYQTNVKVLIYVCFYMLCRWTYVGKGGLVETWNSLIRMHYLIVLQRSAQKLPRSRSTHTDWHFFFFFFWLVTSKLAIERESLVNIAFFGTIRLGFAFGFFIVHISPESVSCCVNDELIHNFLGLEFRPINFLF